MSESSIPAASEDNPRKLPKTFEPSAFEERWYRLWEADGRFQPQGPPGSPRFSMVIPPPNVTGKLHIGHAYGRTIEDILARWMRMRGHRVVWVPGTDHAGIATQMVMERQLAKQGIDRRELGREKFIERVWAWKRETKDTILSQLRKLGCSLDWSRERFTLDPDLSRAVRRAFVQLFHEGLIYRGRYVVNWCPRCGTAVSDLEVVHREEKGTLYRIRYDVSGVPSGAVVATTRPETMLGDTALAIHPDDPRTAKLRGKTAVLPIVGRELPVIEDGILVDREFGTGIVKVTPAHDVNDFAAGQRHALPSVVVIGPDGKMTAEAGEFAGLDRFEARKAVLARLTAENRLVGSEPHAMTLGTCQRCDTVIEPYLSTQWFVKIAPLAAPAIQAVEDGVVRFAPAVWTKTYFEWMRNIRDWCISRQLWWGHRIPAFTCANGHLTVSETDPKACEECGSEAFEQDPDVLDTWFSSQLWPFSVFGWPEETEDYRDFYPTDTLVTGYDILFFWVARMIMAGIHFTGRAPFSVVHLHGLVRVGGEKMSKTRGNVIDPLEAIAEFGADAVRFTLAAAAASGPTVSVERGRMAGSRNFATKLWNAARFTLSQIEEKGAPRALAGRAMSLPDRWILSRLNRTAQSVNRHLAGFRFDEAAQAIYAFLWHELCDGYLEMVKPLLSAPRPSASADGAPEGPAAGVLPAALEDARETARGVLARCLADSLALLHPFMPFVTEEIWEKMTGEPGTLIVAAYPQGDEALADEPAEKVVEAMRAVVTRVRNFRTEHGFSPTEPVELELDRNSPDAPLAEQIATLFPLLHHMARLSGVKATGSVGGMVPATSPAISGVEGTGSVGKGTPSTSQDLPGVEGTGSVGSVTSRDVLEGLSIGLSVARSGGGGDGEKLARTRVVIDEEIASLSLKLRNTSFLDKAPPAVVDKARRRLAELEERRSALSTAGA